MNLHLPKNTILLTSVSFSFLIAYIYLFNKFTDIKEDIANRKNDAIGAKNSHVTLVLSLLFLMLPIPFIIKTNVLLLILYIFIALLGFFYSHKMILFNTPFRLKNIIFLKNISAAVMWSLPLAMVPSILRGNIVLYDFISLSLLFLIAFSIEIFWDIRDMEGDKKHHVNTIPNTYGILAAKIISAAQLALASAIFAYFSYPFHYLATAVSLMVLILLTKKSWNFLYFHAALFVWIIAMLADILIKT